jgi:hypothetical protein
MQKEFKKQRFVSLSLGLSFIVMLISSFVLYLQPDRGVTAWSGWSLFAIDKGAWDNLHITLGLLFLVFLIWHIYYNWKPIKHYLKVKKKWVVLTKEFNASLLLVVFFFLGTLYMLPPLNVLINVGNGVKAMHAKENGTPPFLFAEKSTLKDFMRIHHMNEESVRLALKHHKIYAKNTTQTLETIAISNHITPKKLFEAMSSNHIQKFDLPYTMPLGLAHETFSELNQKYSFDLEKFIGYLKREYSIKVVPTSRFKKVTVVNNLHPATLYSMLLASQIEDR